MDNALGLPISHVFFFGFYLGGCVSVSVVQTLHSDGAYIRSTLQAIVWPILVPIWVAQAFGWLGGEQ